MSKLNIITDKGVPRRYHTGNQFELSEIVPDETYVKETNALVKEYWNNVSQPELERPLFYRTREELESLAGLGSYSKLTHRYENSDSSVIGIEITFVDIDFPEVAYLKLRPFTIWDTVGDDDDILTFPPMRKNARIVVTKETVANLVRHIDPLLAWNFNQHRAFLLEITVGKNDKGECVAILRHIHHFIKDFLCAESHNPVRIPSE